MTEPAETLREGKVWRGRIAACHTCGVPRESLPAHRLLNCSKCKIAQYCSKRCQTEAWKTGGHKIACDRLRMDKEFSDAWNRGVQRKADVSKLMGMRWRVSQWVLHNQANLFTIACAALQNDLHRATLYCVSIYLTCVAERMPTNNEDECMFFITDRLHKSDDREFYIDQVDMASQKRMDLQYARNVWEGGGAGRPEGYAEACRSKIFVHCGKIVQQFVIKDLFLEHLRLPPHLSLDDFITSVNRGISVFKTSFLDRLPPGDAHEDMLIAYECYWRLAGRPVLPLENESADDGAGAKSETVFEIGVLQDDGTEFPLLSWDRKGKILDVGEPRSEASQDTQAFKRVMLDESESNKPILALGKRLMQVKKKEIKIDQRCE